MKGMVVRVKEGGEEYRLREVTGWDRECRRQDLCIGGRMDRWTRKVT